jgi:hypothetical protein
MGITVTKKIFNVSGGRAQVTANLAFDSSYPAGGTNLYPDELFGMHTVEFALISPASGYSFDYDYTNKKIKVFAPAPPVIYEEKHTVTSDVITTNYPAAFITNVARTGNNKKLRSTGIALASLGDDEACLVSVMAAGERTQIRVKDYDRLVSQGLFTGGATTGWTFSDSLNSWTVDAGSGNIDKDAGGAETMTHTFTPTIGRTYRLAFTISGWTAGTLTATCGGCTLTARGADGVFTEEFTATSAAALVLTPTTAARFTLDTVTVYDLSEPIYVTYITQAWKDVWDNLVQDETLTLGECNNSLGELMPNEVDRNFTAASAWADGTYGAGYGETSDLSLTSDAAGEYCTLPMASCPTSPGKIYTLSVDVSGVTGSFTIKNFAGTQTIGTVTAAGSNQQFDFTATTGGGLRIVAAATVSIGDFINFSLVEKSADKSILACMYVDQTTATAAALTMVDEDDTPASGEIAIRFNQATGQFNCNSGQSAKAVKTTYIKNPGSGFLYERSFDNETATKRASGSTYLNTFTKPVLLWGYSGQMPVNGGTTQRMIDSAATPGTGEFKPYWSKGARTIPAPPPLVVEELVTVTANLTGTLAYIPLYIVAVEALATATPVVCHVIPVSKTPGANQVSVDFTTGGLTFRAADSITTARITYIPKRDSGYLSSVTVDEALAAAAAGTPKPLAAQAGLIQYVWDNTDGAICVLEQANVEPTATHYVQIEQTTGTTKVDSYSDDDNNVFWVTYVPYSQIPPGCYVADGDLTLSSQVYNFTGDPGVTGYNHTVVPGYGTRWAGQEVANPHYGVWTGPSGTLGHATGVATWNPATNSIVTDDATAVTILTMNWMILDVNQLTPALPRYGGQIIDLASNVTGTLAGVWGDVDELQNLQPLEVKEGTNLSGLSMRILMIGN